VAVSSVTADRKTRATLAAIPGAASGIVTRSSADAGEQPRDLAVSKSRGGSWTSDARRLIRAIGKNITA
jgi:hypothetical protein